LNKKYKDRAAWLNWFMGQWTENCDSTTVMHNIAELKQVAKKNKDKELMLEADLIKVVYLERQAGSDE
jgi:hypothetical protein